ncbi:hypothetical protein BHM03_00061752 [Ensete ventricosum]|nr:hypothetical protein BHM03_00061752 [Ensete ventricosum]
MCSDGVVYLSTYSLPPFCHTSYFSMAYKLHLVWFLLFSPTPPSLVASVWNLHITPLSPINAISMTIEAIAPTGNGQTVCVTGAGGFIASWLVKLLLEKGYTVKGTVRSPGEIIGVQVASFYSFVLPPSFETTAASTDDPKNAHLKAMEGAAERLILCKADLLDYDALREAIDGCQGVFHTASPVTDDPVR